MHLFFFCCMNAERFPKIKELFGHDPNMKWKVATLVLIQCCMVTLVADMKWMYVFLLAYCFGGVINHALMLGKVEH